MKLLLDACVWPRAADELRKQGHDIALVSQRDRAMSDNKVLEWAFHEGRTIITLDKDFGKLVVLHGRRHCGIVRLVDLHPSSQAGAFLDAVQSYGSELLVKSIVTISKDRCRIRPLK